MVWLSGKRCGGPALFAELLGPRPTTHALTLPFFRVNHASGTIPHDVLTST